MAYFKVSDFPLAVTLVSLGFKVEFLSKETPSRIEFNFQHADPLDETVQAFWRDEIRIEPKLFYLNQKLLKSRINATK